MWCKRASGELMFSGSSAMTVAPLLGFFRQLNDEELSWRPTPCSLAASTVYRAAVRTAHEPGADLDQGSLIGENVHRGIPFWPPRRDYSPKRVKFSARVGKRRSRGFAQRDAGAPQLDCATRQSHTWVEPSFCAYFQRWPWVIASMAGACRALVMG